jgi:2-oxoglutarate dehydrogenase E1 component
VGIKLQLAPFPFDLVMRELKRYPNAKIMWAQEEPLNMGGFHHVSPRIETVMRHEVCNSSDAQRTAP